MVSEGDQSSTLIKGAISGHGVGPFSRVYGAIGSNCVYRSMTRLLVQETALVSSAAGGDTGV